MHRCLALFLILFGLALPAVAEVVPDLYQGVVPVPDQGRRALDAAAGEALAQVLVKVSGSEAILDNPAIRESLASARRQVQQYSYVQPGPGTEGLQARIEFGRDYVTGLVITSGEPLWTANRPAVLAWVVVEDERGRRFATRDSDPDLVWQLRHAFARRAVPLQLPLYDLTDATAIAVDDVWQLGGPPLQAASHRYGVDHLVAARMTRLGDGRWLGDLAYFTGYERYDRRIESDSAADFLAQGAAEVARQMAARYAVLPAPGGRDTVPLVITGVASFSDYAALVSWLERLELVEAVRPRRLRGDRVELALDARADAAQLGTLIALNRHLVPALPPGAGQPLEYLWQK